MKVFIEIVEVFFALYLSKNVKFVLKNEVFMPSVTLNELTLSIFVTFSENKEFF